MARWGINLTLSLIPILNPTETHPHTTPNLIAIPIGPS